MEVEVPAPDTLDLEPLRGAGPAPGEALQPEDEPAAAAGGGGGGAGAAAGGGAGGGGGGAVEPDEGIVAQLVSMGFSENGSKRAGAAARGRRAAGAHQASHCPWPAHRAS
jgi:ubiquitin carboxyl-terminal hydrolase 5/13